MAAFSLLHDPWIPVRRRSGARERIRPPDLTSDLATDPITAFDWPRADFDLACRELLIGLLALAGHAEASDLDGWLHWWKRAPDPDELDRRLAPFAPAFLLDGPGPRFMQDAQELPGSPEEIGKLLIEAPGEQTLALNKDLFVKRGGVAVLGRPAAAMALFTLQDFAPGGGQGHRTSLRGGGPLVTLVLPDPDAAGEPPLWHQLWLGVVWEPDWPAPDASQLPRIFPWLAPTRTSEKGRVTTPEDVHPAQAYIGMPRRIRLVFEPNGTDRPCDLLGDRDTVLVTGFHQRPHGTNYAAWRHPLTPYYRQKPESVEWLPAHPQPYRLGYRDWLGLVVADAPSERETTRLPARAVVLARERLAELGRRSARLLAAGFDMKKMKARGFVEAEMPLPLVRPERRESFEAASRELVRRAREVASLLGGCVRQALWSGEAPGADAGDRYLAQERFWDATEPAFLATLRDLAGRLETAEPGGEEGIRAALEQARSRFSEELRRTALSIFDALVRFDEIDQDRTMERRIQARRRLVAGLREPSATGAPATKRRKAA